VSEFDGWYKYVPNADVHEWQVEGWEVCEVMPAPHHDAYSVVMKWVGEGEPLSASPSCLVEWPSKGEGPWI
jgi:hypothetical protein